MVSHQSRTLLLFFSLAITTVTVTRTSSEVSHSLPGSGIPSARRPPNDAFPLPLTKQPSSSGSGGVVNDDRFYVGQRQQQQLISGTGTSVKSNNIKPSESTRSASVENNNAKWTRTRYLNSNTDFDSISTDSKPLNEHCTVYLSLAKVICRQLELKSELPYHEPYFDSILHGVFLNTSSKTQIKLQDLKILFPNLVSLSITQSTTADTADSDGESSETNFGHNHNNLLNEIFMLQDEAHYHLAPDNGNGNGNGKSNVSGNGIPIESSRNGKPGPGPEAETASYKNTQTKKSPTSTPAPASPPPSRRRKVIIWPSVKILNLSNNNMDESIDDDDEFTIRGGHHSHEEYNSISISKILNVFPNLEQLELKGNRITTLKNITRQNQLKFIDISDNPLDCTSEEIKWLESSNITLLNLENTLCDRPPHQNKPKPILQTIHLIKKVQEECRLNCSCEIDYIWEQGKVIHSKTSVNCSSRNFADFPDPDKLPQPTDTLYLNNNYIRSLKKFVYDTRYTTLNVMNLYLDNNQISSLNELEQSDWIYNFQILSLRKNNLTEVHVHLLENIIRLNRWVYQIDLSDNNWVCECRTVSTFKVWLLQHYKFVKNIGNVKCGRTGREIRYLRNEDWCEIEQSKPIIEFLDILNIFMGLLIILIIGKVMYDYWNLSRHGKVPWLVGKIW